MEKLRISVYTQSGCKAVFGDIVLGRLFDAESSGVCLRIGSEFPYRAVFVPTGKLDFIRSIEYDLVTDMKNYYKVIPPDSGRNYMNTSQLIDFWVYSKESAANDIKMPIYLFLGQDMCMSMCMGIVGRNCESEYYTLEPREDRALLAYMRMLSFRIKRGTDAYPLPRHIAQENADGVITEYIYFKTAQDATAQPWMLTLRDFAAWQTRLFNLKGRRQPLALSPLWCSWTDWHSNDVTDAVILQNVKEGVKLGIRNYIIDDGWFGPGLDNDYSVELNIGDWEPDPCKIPNMKRLVHSIRAEGGVPMIWCAPHAVSPYAKCFGDREQYLIADAAGKPVMTYNMFHSICFMCPEGRAMIAGICGDLISKWDFDGAKYDLFNCLPGGTTCESPCHRHDTDSMLHALELTLELMDSKCRNLKPDYIVELKQNYATPFLLGCGSMVRAGDTPYCNEGNFLRTLYVQAYTPYALNDYQTITSEDSPEDAACVVIKMLAAGIPSYSIDFSRLTVKNKAVIKNYNGWYTDNIHRFHASRIPVDPENRVIRLECPDEDFYFLVNGGGNLSLRREVAVILNGTKKEELLVRFERDCRVSAAVYDCFGNERQHLTLVASGWVPVPMLPGGRLILAGISNTISSECSESV